MLEPVKEKESLTEPITNFQLKLGKTNKPREFFRLSIR